MLIAIGSWGYPSVPDKGFHTHAGWIAFNVIGLGIVMFSHRLRYFATTAPLVDRVPLPYQNPTAVYLAPFLTVLTTTMITGAFSDGFDRFYSLRVAAARRCPLVLSP